MQRKTFLNIAFNYLMIFNLLSLMLLSQSCQNTSNASKRISMKTNEQIIHINNQGDIDSLHPHVGIDLQCRIFQKALFEGLTRINAESVPELAGAASYTVSESKLEYIFHLRPMQWSNGEPVKASDYVRAWHAAIAPSSCCLRADLFYPIKHAQAAKMGEISLDKVGVKALDDTTLAITLEHPTPYLLDLLANPLFSPLFDDAVEPTCFNGPFTIEEYVREKQLTLCQNEQYWDVSNVQLEKICISFVHDPNTAVMMYEKGELDWVGAPFTLLPLDATEKIEQSDDFQSAVISGVYWLCLNTKQKLLENKKIRQSLSMVLDRKMIARDVLMGESVCKSMLPPGMSLLEESELYKDNNVKMARHLFDEGLKELNLTREKPLKLVLSHSNIGGQKKLSEALQQTWEQAFDIEIALNGSEWNTFFANLGQKQFDIGGCIWFSAFNDPIYNLEFFKDKTHRYNSPSWHNENYCKLLELADQEVDLEIRREHLKQAERLILEEMPIIPLYVYSFKYLKSPKVQGVNLSHLGQVDFKQMYIQDEALTTR